MTTDLQFHLDAAIQHHRSGRLSEAEAIYREILAHEPEQPDALHLLGLIAHQADQNQTAVELIQRAIAVNPMMAEYYSNLGLALTALGEIERATEAYQAAVKLNPCFPEAYYNLGNALDQQGESESAIAAFQMALAFNPNFAKAHYNLGNVLQKRNEPETAINCYYAAIRIKPDYAEAYHNLGVALMDRAQLDLAVAAFRNAIANKPDYAEAYNSLGNALLREGSLDDATSAYLTSSQLDPNYSQPQSNRIFAMHYQPADDAKAIYEAHRRWNLQYAEPLAKCVLPHKNDRNPDRRLKIGYVSPDFREHPVGRHIWPLLETRNRQQFEIVCYSSVSHPDPMTERIRNSVDGWREIRAMPDDCVAQAIRDDGIDILVDLALHTAGTRLLVFARKPAPVQVTFAGYPSTTGLDAIDYRITDSWLDPPNRDAFYSEDLIRLPDSFWLYDATGQDVEVNSLPARDAGAVTFGCLNNFCKITDRTFELWAEVLRRVDDAHLVILTVPGSHRNRALDILKAGSIMPHRVEFIANMPRPDYLRLYQRLDIVLDTFPYGGHTTTCDALWMGVPMVTRAGQTAVSRGGLSILANIGLQELVANSDEDYIRIATNLAADLQRMESLRTTLRNRMTLSPLMDSARYSRNMEDAYRTMWRRWCSAEN